MAGPRLGAGRRPGRKSLRLYHRRRHQRRRLARLFAVAAAPSLRRRRRARRPDRIPRHLHRRRQQFRGGGRDADATCSTRTGRASTRCRRPRKISSLSSPRARAGSRPTPCRTRPTSIIAGSGNTTSTATAPMRRTAVCPDPALLCFPDLNGTLSNLITTTGQTVPATGSLGDQRAGRNRPHLDVDQQLRRHGAGGDFGTAIRSRQ